MEADHTIKVTILNDFPLIVSGLAAMFEKDPRITLAEQLSGTYPDVAADITLFDDFADERPGETLENLANNPHAGKVVLFTWRPDSPFAQAAVQRGADGVIDKSLDAAALVDALLTIATNDGPPKISGNSSPTSKVPWPGKNEGLSARESEVLSLIAQGNTNDQIAELCDLSINSVKSYIRTAYRKIGVERRSQAVVWAIEHGLLPSIYRG